MIAPSQDMQRVVDEVRQVSRDLSVIVVSVEAPGAEAHGVQPTGFLAKPYTLEALGKALDRALAAKEAA
jgi:two-component SAPR family response regulator